MVNISSAILHTIPITLFNRGLAGKIFGDVKKTGAKVVMKNNVAECVLLSPEEYLRLINEVNDARLLSLATERMAHYNPNDTLSEEEVERLLGVTPEDLDACGEVEVE